MQPLFRFSTLIMSIDLKTLPDEIYFSSSSIRKWIQIEIRTHGTLFNSNFKFLSAPLCRRPPVRGGTRTPYYSSSWDDVILLYESLKIPGCDSEGFFLPYKRAVGHKKLSLTIRRDPPRSVEIRRVWFIALYLRELGQKAFI